MLLPSDARSRDLTEPKHPLRLDYLFFKRKKKKKHFFFEQFLGCFIIVLRLILFCRRRPRQSLESRNLGHSEDHLVVLSEESLIIINHSTPKILKEFIRPCLDRNLGLGDFLSLFLFCFLMLFSGVPFHNAKGFFDASKFCLSERSLSGNPQEAPEGSLNLFKYDLFFVFHLLLIFSVIKQDYSFFFFFCGCCRHQLLHRKGSTCCRSCLLMLH